jgi:tetratricopeptide (TPR) repeat protein
VVQDHAAVLHTALDSLEASQFAKTEAACRQLLNADAGDVAAMLVLGLTFGARRDIKRAVPLLVRVAWLRSGQPFPCSDWSQIHVRLRCRQLFVELYRKCLRLHPDDDRLRYYFAESLHESSALKEAVIVLVDGIRRRPDWVLAHHLLGFVLADLGLTDAAIAEFRRVVAMCPGPAAGWANLGMMLKVQGQFDAAIEAYDKAIAREPQGARIKVNRAVVLLQAGRFSEAWPDYEWRLSLPGHQALDRERLLPAVSTVGDLTGKTILVTHEEGFGDTLQFLRYVPLLAEHGARVVVWVPQPLERVLRCVPGVAAVLSGNQSELQFNFHCPFLSLPRAFETTLETIPATVPYLFADPAMAAGWAARLPVGGVRVGLVWAGQARPWLPGFDVVDARRSMPLATLAPLAKVPGASFVSLQMGAGAKEVKEPPPGLSLFDAMSDTMDFADTAAIIANLDIVVSVDTSVVHLAGAMGKPVMLLDRYDNCWRWLSGREDSPWYPGLRIFRQERLGDWRPVVARVAMALTRLAAGGHPCPAPVCQGAA